ncbi:MAG TPA: hypothetical protein VLA53_04365 [Nitrosopumilaceae archaeon]|nr:hypothetical protein [Nitrosopumilaceae archaeon]
MAKKRGIVVTIAILAAITGASFFTWFIPQMEDSSFVVFDFKDHLESIQARQKVIADEIETDLQEMLAGKVTPDNFIIRAEVSISQINALIIELIESKAPQEWHESYLNYGESLKSYNSYLMETIVLANEIKGDNLSDIKENLERLDVLKKESEAFALKADETKP